ncbi:MAG TPA: transcription termination/antitermination NusG family protein [Candidatus Limnocylindria bacterium]|nr:transcription termination/antitermination NusG family protein [Candidatus Limnocylindria bacterium]
MGPLWHVAHLRPRCEKKVAAFCVREGFAHALPLYRSVKRYRGKQLVFLKPLFPNYLFLHIAPAQRTKVRQQQHVANLLEPPDQAEFAAQLGDILRALDIGTEVRLAPHISEGQRVRLKQGPLRGLEGLVARRQGAMEVILRLDFIGQAAAVKVLADEVEPA